MVSLLLQCQIRIIHMARRSKSPHGNLGPGHDVPISFCCHSRIRFLRSGLGTTLSIVSGVLVNGSLWSLKQNKTI